MKFDTFIILTIMNCGFYSLSTNAANERFFLIMAVPNNKALARLVGAPSDYLKSASQRKSEELTGNGWTVDVIAHILKGGLL